MSELTALEKHACPACGAQAEWHPAQQKLVCGYCGTTSPYETDGAGEVREIDLVKTLREMGDDERGWAAEKKTVRCQSCRAVQVFDPERVGQNCEFCGSPALVDYEELKAPIRPGGVLPFRLGANAVRERLKAWLAGRWFAPNALRKRALVDTIRGVYLPYWTFDAQVHCPWTALAGHYYYVTQTYRSGGQTKTRRVRKVRWVPAAGAVDHFFDDEPISGARSVDPDLLRGVEPFPTKEAVPYDTSYLAGFVVEHYQVVLIDAAKAARERMHAALLTICGAQVPGDTYTNLQISPTYSAQTFKHVLVPVWLLRYDFGKKSFQVLVNGVTGRVAGRYPKSWVKIALAVSAALVVGAVVYFLAR